MPLPPFVSSLQCVLRRARLAALREAGRPVRSLILGLISCGLSGCETVHFYSQAIDGQAEILFKARPIPAVLRDPQTPADVRHKLEIVEAAREFAARELLLPATHEYYNYTDLRRPYVSWVLFAAPEFSTEGRTWWYPLVGSLKYRGYFADRDAIAEAKRMKARGDDVYVGGVEAYSTLGWFHDPVLNTFFKRTDAELAELVFHELTHVKLFIPGDSDFNEAFATANAEAGVRRWLRARADFAALEKYESALAKDREIVRLLLATRARLAELYARQEVLSPELRAQKATILAGLRQSYLEIRAHHGGGSLYDRAFEKPWNNARLNTVATYYDLVPGFERLIAESHGDIRAFYAKVEQMRRLSRKDRRQLLVR